jgi:hypothetical protein
VVAAPVVATTGSTQGARIRWKAGTERGFLSLNVDLEPGARAKADDRFDAHGANCLATLL